MVMHTISSGSSGSCAEARAREAYLVLRRTWWIGGARLYRGERRAWAHLWPLSQVILAAGDVAAMDNRAGANPTQIEAQLRQGTGRLGAYWDGHARVPGYDSAPRPPWGRGGDKYYDDNAWIGRALLRSARLGVDSLAPTLAAVGRFVRTGWDEDPAAPCPGGVAWVRASHNGDRNTVSTAPSALLVLGLAGNDNEAVNEAIAWAARSYGWVRRCLGGADQLYGDHVRADGAIDATRWSYNQGAMIALGAALALATGEERYRREAVATARATLTWLSSPDCLQRQPVAFNALFLRDLLTLRSIGEASIADEGLRMFAAYAHTAWQHCRDPRTGRYRFSANGTGGLLHQAAMVQLHALLAGIAP